MPCSMRVQPGSGRERKSGKIQHSDICMRPLIQNLHIVLLRHLTSFAFSDKCNPCCSWSTGASLSHAYIMSWMPEDLRPFSKLVLRKALNSKTGTYSFDCICRLC